MRFFRNEKEKKLIRISKWKQFRVYIISSTNFHFSFLSLFFFFLFIIIIIPKLFSKFYKEPEIREYKKLIFSLDIKRQYMKIWNRKFLHIISKIPIAFLLLTFIIFCSFLESRIWKWGKCKWSPISYFYTTRNCLQRYTFASFARW